MEGLFAFLLFVFLGSCGGLELRNGAYEGFVVRIQEGVPVQDCRIVLDNLEQTLSSASQYLFSALDSRAFLRSATVLLPASWPDTCASSTVASGSGETSDVTVLPLLPSRGRTYTQQSLGCGQPGDQIYVAYQALMQRDATLARTLVKEFAMYRFGVFEEQGYGNDPIYPMCYYDDEEKRPKATGCSDYPIDDLGICTSNFKALYNTTEMVDPIARSSIMFAAEAQNVSLFCDDGNHDRYAPTKHNSICQRRSVLDVIMKHSDFNGNSAINNVNSNQLIDTSIKITYKKQNLTRYVFVLENTKDMMQRESWSYLRLALRYFALHVIPDNTEVGMVLAEESSKKVLGIASMKSNYRDETSQRDNFYSKIPYTPGEYLKGGCLDCALKDAVDMLSERTRSHGPASNVIVVIAPGMEITDQTNKVLEKVKKNRIRIATINYPTIARSRLLNLLAEETNGVAYTVFEHKLNVDTTLLSTYFELKNALNAIVQTFYSGSTSDLPIEIHRREIQDDSRSSITGSFMLDSTMGKPSQFTFFTHNTITPLIKGLKLISPSHHVYVDRNDRYIDFKMIGLTANISESGTWTYVVEPYPGNPQPHFLQVTATPNSATAPVVRAKFWTHRTEGKGPLILLVEVKRGEIPVLGAKVEVKVRRPEVNGSYPYESTLELLDTGAGDPDITKGDGVYTRYFNLGEHGVGLYDFEVAVSDNGNTAYTWTDNGGHYENRPCCGSSIPSPGDTIVSPFQRVLPRITLMITEDDIANESTITTGKVGDLKPEVLPNEQKVRLTWTAPDIGGQIVARYDVKYAFSAQDITDGFETNARSWDSGSPPLPLAPGSETTFTIDLSQYKDLLDKPLYFAIKAYPKHSSDLSGPASNWVRVVVPSPPPPPTEAPTYSSNEHSFWPGANGNSVGVDPIRPTISKSMGVGLELILPIVIGLILLVVLLIVYCYFCIQKRRDHRDTDKKHSKNDNLNTTITIVPSSPQHVSPTQNTYVTEMPDPHQVGVPVKYDYEEDTKKRYSLVHQQEQQLIEELKQQQQFVHRDMGTPNAAYQGLSVISTGTLTRTGHALSPYNSWSASQLLHEHERRHSPLDPMEDPANQDLLMAAPVPGEEPYPGQHHVPPPVPPLPAFGGGYPAANYAIYGVHQAPPAPIYQSMQGAFNPSLQGSLSSVNSGDKKRRNVTMV